MGKTFLDPFRAGMIFPVGLVPSATSCSAYRRIGRNLRRTTILMMCSVEHLSRFKNHLYYMLIAVPFGTPTGLATKKEDVHRDAERRGKQKSQFFPSCALRQRETISSHPLLPMDSLESGQRRAWRTGGKE